MATGNSSWQAPAWIKVGGQKGNKGATSAIKPPVNTGFQAQSERICITSLPPYMTDEMLTEIFGNYGTVVSTNVLNNAKPLKDGSLESVCLVTMSSTEEAAALLQKMDGNVPEGLLEPVSIKFAGKPINKATTKAALSMAAAMDNTQPVMERSIYVGNLPNSMDQETFVSICGIHGKVLASQIHHDKNVGIAVFATVKEATLALDIVNGFEHEGVWLTAKAADGTLPFNALKAWERAGIDGTSVPQNEVGGQPETEGGGLKGAWNKARGKGVGWQEGETEYQVRPHTNKLYVTGLPQGASEDLIRAAFTEHGEVMHIRIVWSNSWGTGAIVQMADRWIATNLVQDYSGVYFETFQATLQIKLAESPEEFNKREQWNHQMGKVGNESPQKGKQNGKGKIGISSSKAASSKGNPQVAATKSSAAQTRESNTPYGQTKKWEASPDIAEELATDIAVEGMPDKATKFDLVRLFGRFGAISGITLVSSSDTKVAFVQFKNPDHAGTAVEKVNGVPLGDGTVLEVLPRWMTPNYAEKLAAETPDEPETQTEQPEPVADEQGWFEEWDNAADAAEQAWAGW